MYKLLITSSLIVTSLAKLVGSEFHEFSANCMGTEFKILIDHDKRDICKKAANAAFAEADRLNKIFSDYHADSEVSILSKSSYEGKAIKLSDELFEVLEFGKSLAISTDNAFDPTIGQLSRLWRISRFRKSLPAKISLNRALRLKGIENLLLNAATKEATLRKPGIILDLGGIAKGYTADKMLEVMNGFGVSRCLVDAGGDITLGNKPRKKSGWRIEIGGRKHPDLPILSLENCSVATSGDVSQFLEINGTRYSHIVNSQTGYGLKNLTQVTIIAENGMKADSLATACSVLGADRTKQLLKEETFKAFFITRSPNKLELEIVD